VTEYIDDNAQLEHAADLRRASDLFVQRLDRLQELETRKRELPPDQPEFIRLAREVEDMARSLLFAGGQQVELAEEVHREAKANDLAIDQSIRDTPPRRDAVAILAEWRAAERRLAAAELGSNDEHEARADVERLRDEYRRITAPTNDA
jgi:DNA repair exonuclease SbcCD ATPase subunit